MYICFAGNAICLVIVLQVNERERDLIKQTLSHDFNNFLLTQFGYFPVDNELNYHSGNC